jgi:hypothetical protein
MVAYLAMPRWAQDKQLRALVRLAIWKAEWAAINSHLSSDRQS